jgi:hypothetical protein
LEITAVRPNQYPEGEGGLWILDGQNKVAFYQKEEVSMNPEADALTFCTLCISPTVLKSQKVLRQTIPSPRYFLGMASDPDRRQNHWRQLLLQNFKVDVKSVEFKRWNRETAFLKQFPMAVTKLERWR